VSAAFSARPSQHWHLVSRQQELLNSEMLERLYCCHFYRGPDPYRGLSLGRVPCHDRDLYPGLCLVPCHGLDFGHRRNLCKITRQKLRLTLDCITQCLIVEKPVQARLCFQAHRTIRRQTNSWSKKIHSLVNS